MTTLLTILFDGVAYGMLLFVLSVGLSVTLGLMNFVNLAHGAFAMVGGYVCAVLVNQSGVPFFVALPIAFIVSAAIGIVMAVVEGKAVLDAQGNVKGGVRTPFLDVPTSTWNGNSNCSSSQRVQPSSMLPIEPR